MLCCRTVRSEGGADSLPSASAGDAARPERRYPIFEQETMCFIRCNGLGLNTTRSLQRSDHPLD